MSDEGNEKVETSHRHTRSWGIFHSTSVRFSWPTGNRGQVCSKSFADKLALNQANPIDSANKRSAKHWLLSITTVAKDSLSVNVTLEKSVGRLCRLGFVQITSKPDEKGISTTNKYVFTDKSVDGSTFARRCRYSQHKSISEVSA